MAQQAVVHDLPALRERSGVFRDRRHAGEVLAQMLDSWRDSDALVLGIPSGGVPVAAEVAARLHLPLDVAVVSKILLPWNTEAGFGAAGYDGSVWINRDYADHYGLDREAISRQVEAALQKVRRRVKRFRGDRPWPDVAHCPVILVDDGLAAGSTLRVAISALRNQGAQRIVVAVPTGHAESLGAVAELADEVYCANVRSGWSFAVASAYQRWTDVEEDEAAAILEAPGRTAGEER